MGFIRVGGALIEAGDAVLDRVAHLLEHPPSSGGFWLAGQLQREVNGELTYPNPAYGHQRMWVSVSQTVTLIYDRPLHPDPDRVDDPGPGVVIV